MARSQIWLLGRDGEALDGIPHIVLRLPSEMVRHLTTVHQIKLGVCGLRPPYDETGVLSPGVQNRKWNIWATEQNQAVVIEWCCRGSLDFSLNDWFVSDAMHTESEVERAMEVSGVQRTTIEVSRRQIETLCQHLGWVMLFLSPDADFLLFASDAKHRRLVLAAKEWSTRHGEKAFELSS